MYFRQQAAERRLRRAARVNCSAYENNNRAGGNWEEGILSCQESFFSSANVTYIFGQAIWVVCHRDKLFRQEVFVVWVANYIEVPSKN